MFCFAFEDVSDRIEKEVETSDILMSLQASSIAVVRGDWKLHIGEALQEGWWLIMPKMTLLKLERCSVSVKKLQNWFQHHIRGVFRTQKQI